MQSKVILICITVGFLMACGQVMFKIGADRLAGSTEFIVYQVTKSPLLIGACFVYAATILLWIWALKQTSLSLAYPFTALAYIITPLMSVIILGERLTLNAIVGYLLIILGIIFCTYSKAP